MRRLKNIFFSKKSDSSDPSLHQEELINDSTKIATKNAVKIFFSKMKFFGKEVVADKLYKTLRSQPKFLLPALIVIIIVGVVVASINLVPVLKQNGIFEPFREFSKLIISPAYAQDNFEVVATDADVLGVESDTYFKITSKEIIDSDTLRSHISLVPLINFDLKKINDHEFELKPEKPLESRTVYNIQIATAFVDENGTKIQRDYSWAFQVKDQFKILQTLPRDKATNVPLDSGIEITFSHDNFINPADAITIEPHIEGSFEVHKRTVVFIPKALSIGTIYTVTVNKNLQLEGSSEGLSDDFVFQFETAAKDYRRDRVNRYFSFSENFNEFSSQQEPALRIYSHDTTSPRKVSIYAFKSETAFAQAVQRLNAVPYWAQYNQSAFITDTSGLTLVGAEEVKPIEYGYSNYLLYPGNLPKGFYLAEVIFDGIKDQTFIQVSDVAAYVSVNVNDTLVWVNNLGDQGPLSGAKVSILDTNITATTDADGIITFSTDKLIKDLKGAETFFIKVQHNGQTTFVPVTVNESSVDYYHNGSNKYWLYFYTDRELYKPTDTIHFWGFIKDRDGASLGQNFKVSLTDNRYHNYYFEEVNIAEADIVVNPDGSFIGSVKIDQVTPGYYYLSLQQGDRDILNHGFQVERFVKPAYQLHVEPQKKALFAGQDIVLNTAASFFEGTPVAHLDLNYFVDNKKNTVKTNEQGEVIITIPTARKLDGVSHTEYINVSPVNSEGGEISAHASVKVFDSRVFPEIKFEKISDTEAQITVQMYQVDLNNQVDYKGSPVSNHPVQIEIKRGYYEKIENGEYYDFINKIVRKKYQYIRRSENIGKAELITTDSSGKLVYTLPIKNDGFYEARVEFNIDRDANETAYQDVYLSGRSLEGVSGSDNYYLKSLNEDKPSVNDLVSLEFTSEGKRLPNENSKRFLYYKLQRGLIDYQVSQNSFYQFNFQPQHVPNVYVQGVWFDGSTYHVGNNWSYFSGGRGLNIEFDDKDRELAIAISADKDQYKPGEEVTLSLRVTDRKGDGVKSAINVSLVDEALFKLRNQSTDILSALYSNIGSGELFTYNTHRLPSLVSGAEGGGCFLAGTKILMANGSEKNIEDVIAGDQVLTFANERADRLVAATVLEKYQHEVSEYLIINNHLEVTPEHRVFINGGWMMIGEASVGDYLLNRYGEPEIIQTIERVSRPITVYNLNIDFFHTYIADGIYVHNDKGGVRDEFVDTAYFSAVTTNDAGYATVSFKLPDNITAWRVTTQAISKALGAGTATKQVNVSLPFFVDDVSAQEYVVGDKPTVKLRAYGDVLQINDAVNYSLEIPSLQFKQSVKGTAFKPSYITIPSLVSGIHEITTKADIGEHNDTVIKPITVLDARLKVAEQKFYELTSDVKIEGSRDDRTDLIFSDKNQGYFYRSLLALTWTYGDRIDQKLSRVIAREMRSQYFSDENFYKEEFDGTTYQLSSGGISLLPYSGADFELTAKVAAVAPDKFDALSMTNYFYEIINDKKSNQEQIGVALFGLASLGEPVLFQVQNYAAIKNLTVKEKLYIALAALKLGDVERARDLFHEVMEKYGEVFEPYVRVSLGDDQDDYVAITSLAAALAGGIGDDLHEGLWLYVRDTGTNDVLVNLEALLHISFALPKLVPGEVKFTITMGDKEINQILDRGRTFTLSVTPTELASLRFSNISGRVGVVSSFNEPVTPEFLTVSPLVSISREYYVGGKKTNTFSQNDVVEIRLNYSINSGSLDGVYAVTDILPSGLAIFSRPYSRDVDYKCTFYPHAVDGQKVTFLVGKNYYPVCGNQIKYFARVVNPGTYITEAAMIQSLKSDEIINISEAGKVLIEQ